MSRRMVMLVCSLLMGGHAFADVPTKTPFPAVSWTSKNQNDIITVQNGSDDAVIVAITVAKSDANQTAGINVNNCGNITHINAGSSGLCTSDDATHPVNFASDLPGTPVSGTYQIKPQTE